MSSPSPATATAPVDLAELKSRIADWMRGMIGRELHPGPQACCRLFGRVALQLRAELIARGVVVVPPRPIALDGRNAREVAELERRKDEIRAEKERLGILVRGRHNFDPGSVGSRGTRVYHAHKPSRELSE